MTVKITYTQQDVENLIRRSNIAYQMKPVDVKFSFSGKCGKVDSFICEVEVVDDEGNLKALVQTVSG